MQISPRYDADPLIVLDGPPAAVAEPTIRQRRRFVEVLGTLDDEQWAAPSRCDAWSVRDVVVHLADTTDFWGFSLHQGRKGEPSRFLATFDPVATPVALVEGAGDIGGPQALERLAASVESLATLLEGLDADAWAVVAEAPPGHVSVTAVVHHALWDSWVHERDIMLPLGLEPEVHADEVVSSLRYAAALAPALLVSEGSDRSGTLVVDTVDPPATFTVEVGPSVAVADGAADEPDLVLTGSGVDLLEALSIRRPLEVDVPADAAWLVSGLADVFAS